jgi:2-hydroxychromene-2-carboxylate isomerase
MPEARSDPIEFYYSVRSVYAYFAVARIADIARRHGRTIHHCPIDLSKVVPAFGSQPFAERSPKARALQFQTEVTRWSQFLELPVLLEPAHHYGDRVVPSCVVLAAQAAGLNTDAVAAGILTALWRDDRDIAHPQVLSEILENLGITSSPVLEAALSDSMRSSFELCTARAIDLGVPGSPSFLVDGQLFYGQDRLMFVERHLDRPFAH